MHFYFCARSGDNTVLLSFGSAHIFRNLEIFRGPYPTYVYAQVFLPVEINVCGVWDQQALSKRIPFKIDLSKVAIFLCRTIPFYRKTYGRWPYVIAKFFQGGRGIGPK